MEIPVGLTFMLRSLRYRWIALVCFAGLLAASVPMAEAAPVAAISTVKVRSPQSPAVATFTGAPAPTWHKALSAVHPALLAAWQLLASLAVLIWFESKAADSGRAAKVRT
ncbi:MAG: hypothetical protein K8T25_19845 [Planctomycetia bacterium]|nr:hypothetical protein [Planctomycetia bacterium]